MALDVGCLVKQTNRFFTLMLSTAIRPMLANFTATSFVLVVTRMAPWTKLGRYIKAQYEQLLLGIWTVWSTVLSFTSLEKVIRIICIVNDHEPLSMCFVQKLFLYKV